MTWECSNCRFVIRQATDPNAQQKPCPKCMLAPPMIAWIRTN